MRNSKEYYDSIALNIQASLERIKYYNSILKPQEAAEKKMITRVALTPILTIEPRVRNLLECLTEDSKKKNSHITFEDQLESARHVLAGSFETDLETTEVKAQVGYKCLHVDWQNETVVANYIKTLEAIGKDPSKFLESIHIQRKYPDVLDIFTLVYGKVSTKTILNKFSKDRREIPIMYFKKGILDKKTFKFLPH